MIWDLPKISATEIDDSQVAQCLDAKGLPEVTFNRLTKKMIHQLESLKTLAQMILFHTRRSNLISFEARVQDGVVILCE